MRISIVIALFYLQLNMLIAQENCKLSLIGKVTDAHNGEALANVAVYIKKTNFFALTDSTGKFEFANLCSGKYILFFNHFDCEPREKQITLETNIDISFQLEHHDNHLHEIVVSEKTFDAQPLQAIQKIKSTAIAEQFGKSLADILSATSGLSAMKTGGQIAKPMVHGLTGQRIVILNNGVKLEAQHWGNEHAPEIDANMVRQIQLIKGASSVRYGADAIGGVIAVQPYQFGMIEGSRQAIAVSHFTNGRKWVLQTFREGILNKTKSLKYYISVNAKRSGNYRSPDYFLRNTSLQEFAPAAAISYKKNKWTFEQYYNFIDASIGIFTGTHIGNLSDFRKAILRKHPVDTVDFSYRLENPRQSIQHQLFKTSVVYQHNERSSFDIFYSFQTNRRREYDRFSSRIDSIAAKRLPALDFTLQTQRIEFLWQTHRDRYDLIFGSDGVLQTNEYRGFYLIPNYFHGGAGLFSLIKFPVSWGKWEAGIRYDFKKFNYKKLERGQIIQPKYTFQNISASLSASARLNSEWSMLFQTATGWRPPSPNELFSDGVHHGAARYELGDRNINREWVWNNLMTVHYAHNKIHLNADLYAAYYDGFINLQPGLQPVVTIRGTFPGYIFKQADAWHTGADIQFQFPIIGELNGECMLSIVNIENINNDSAFALVPPNRAIFKLNYHLPENKVFTENHFILSTHMVDKQRNAAADFVDPPPAYALVSVVLQSTIKLKSKSIQFQCEVFNLFNKKYRDYLDTWRYFTDAPGIDIQWRIQYVF